MDDSDKKGFKSLMDGLTEYYRIKNPRLENLSVMVLQIYFGTLKEYSLDQVQEAASKHIADPDVGFTYPSASDLIKHLDGGKITADTIIASAKLAKTPLGCMARIKIGTWDLSQADSFYLRERATECLMELPEWKERAKRGEYTDHEISVMLKYGVDPSSPFVDGISGPKNSGQLDSRVKMVESSPEHKKQVEPPYVPVGDIEKAMHETMKKIMGSRYE